MESNRAIPLIFTFSLIAFLQGCGGGQAAPSPLSVSLTPSSAQTVDQSRSLSFTSAVANDKGNQGVTWSLTCPGSSCGTLSSQTNTSATYTAPNAVTANITVKVTATSLADKTKSNSVAVTVVPPPSVTTSSVPDATTGTAYSVTLQAAGGIAPYNWVITAGTLPPGLDLNADGSITGTPAAGGKFSFTAQVMDAASPPLTATANLAITSVVVPLSITTTTLPNGTVDTAYKQLIEVTGGIPPYTWTIVSGALPSWATLNLSTGTISGIPGTGGSANFIVHVADSQSPASTDTQTLTLTVAAGSAANNSELDGHYAFLFNGFDEATGSPIGIAGSFIADSNGKIIAGIEDENGPNGSALNVSFTGTYNIGSDNRGAFTIVTAGGSKTYAIVLNSVNGGIAQKARFIEFDDTTGTNGQRGSGLLRLQDTAAFAQSKITGPYAFGFEGQNATGKRKAMAGSFNADGAGSIATGIADENIAGTHDNPSLTGTYTAPSNNNGRLTMKLDASSGSSLDLAAYVVSANEFLALTTNSFSSNGLISGGILSQTSNSFNDSALDAPAVYYQFGVDPNVATTKSFGEIGLLSPDGGGSLSITFDKNQGGGITQNQKFDATYSVSSTGRVTISGWYGDTTSALRIMYLLNKNEAFFLDTDASAGLGFVEPQSSPAGGFSNASLSGTFSVATVAPSVSPDPSACGVTTLDGLGGFSQIANFITSSARLIDQATSGTYVVEANGRGTVTNLKVTASSVSTSLGLLITVSLLFGSTKRLNKSGPAHVILCLTILLAITLASCTFTNQLVFYIVSSKKAIMMHEAQPFEPTPVISVIER